MNKIMLFFAFTISFCDVNAVSYTVRYIDGVTKDNYVQSIDAVCDKMEKRALKLAQQPIVDFQNPPALIADNMRNQVKILKHLKAWIENGRKDDAYKKELKMYAYSDVEIGKLMLSILDEDSTAK